MREPEDAREWGAVLRLLVRWRYSRYLGGSLEGKGCTVLLATRFMNLY